MGADGKERELHVDKALQVIDWDNAADPRCTIEGPTIQRCEYFQLDRVVLSTEESIANSGESFHAHFIAEGEGFIRWDGGEEKLAAGQSWLVPAGLRAYSIQPEGEITLLRVTIP